MALTIKRTESDGSVVLVGYCGGWEEVGAIIYEDRKGIDWEATYMVETEGGNEPENHDP